MGFTPQLVDLNGDGHRDMITGSWPGELFFFEADGSGDFAKAVMLQDKNDKYINVGGGIEESDDRIMITGNATFEKTDEGTFVDYHGKRLESTAEKPVMITGTASVVHATDWDNDGDFDLLVGDIRGRVYLIPNEGSATKLIFGEEQQLEAAGKTIRVPGGDAGPVTADWDADGDLDLIVGCGDGSVVLYRNEGTRDEPELASVEELIPAGDIKYGPEASLEAVRGTRAKVCVTDFNGDGKLDLLVGDVATLGQQPQDLTEDEQKQHDAWTNELARLGTEHAVLIRRIMGPNRVKDEEKLKDLREEMRTMQAQMTELRNKLPPKYTMHGWVWCFEATDAEPEPDTEEK